MTQGKIVKLVRHRGFGFINTEATDDDIFFHHTGLENAYFDDLSIGDKLEFEINKTEKGPEANDIVKINLQDDNSMTQDGDEMASNDGIEQHLGW